MQHAQRAVFHFRREPAICDHRREVSDCSLSDRFPGSPAPADDRVQERPSRSRITRSAQRARGDAEEDRARGSGIRGAAA